MPEQIGFIGLGIMGKPMAKNLLKAGYSLTVYDIVGEPVEELVTEGAARGSSNKDVAAKSDTIITMVPDSADSEAAILGPEGALEGARPGSVIIDMSSIAPLVSQRIAGECAKIRAWKCWTPPSAAVSRGLSTRPLPLWLGESRRSSTNTSIC